MENVKLSFLDEELETELTLFANTQNKLYIEIDMKEFSAACIALNKSTAIKLSKELRKQISYLENDYSEDEL